MKCVCCCVIFIFVVTLMSCFENFIKFHQSVLIKFFQILICNHIGIRIEVIKVAEAISCSISDLTIVIGNLLQDFRADADICVIIGRSNPQTKNVCAVLVDNLLRSDTVAE